ncbi:MAG: L-rhamnose/proton symporter RhaT [Acidobacteria bacterium]|nr:L-rhamnose/proton symporter RhaT [Acidobacteriota bacterium]
MGGNPLLGVFLHWLGGLASASFYVPYRRVRGWSWETYWLAGGVMSWIIVPWILALSLTRNLFHVLGMAPTPAILWTYFFGVLWGLGGLTFGLTMRYLGLSLGMSVALGYTAVFGTLVPPIFHGQFTQLLAQRSGIIILVGVGICIGGIVLAGAAGISKENELSHEEKLASIQEFSLKRGLGVATFCGVMSSCFAFGLDAGNPIKELTIGQGTPVMWQGLPVLVVLLAGGFTTNFIWCLVLSIQNKSYGEYLRIPSSSETESMAHPPIENVTDAASTEMALESSLHPGATSSLAANYAFSALAGATWYMQFFFYTMGETQMGQYKFSSWTLHMASIMIFSTIWGIALKEWRGVSLRTKVLVFLTLLTLVGSTVVVGYGNLQALKP